MKRNRGVLTISLMVLFTAGFVLAACERPEPGIEAAREDAVVLSPEEQDFLQRIATSMRHEAELAQIATQKAVSDEVRNYADMIVNDHEDTLEDVRDLMEEKHVATTPAPAEIEQERTELEGLAGADFDREFVNTMIEGHQRTIQAVRLKAQTAVDPDVREFADDLLPTVEEHLDEALELQSNLAGVPR